MLFFLSLVTSAKDYFEIVHKLIEFHPNYSIIDYNEFGSLLIYFILTIKNFFIEFITLNWLQNIWSLPIIIPDIASAMISEISVLDGYFHNALTFLETPLSYGKQNFSIYGLEKFSIGLINSFFLFLPTSAAHIIMLRRFVFQGIEAGYIAGFGIISGNIFWLASILFGWRFFVIPWLSLDIFRYLLGFIILIKDMWHASNDERRTAVLSNLSKSKMFLITFLLTLTEQTSLYPFLTNISIGAESTILETFPVDNFAQFIFIHSAYLFGIFAGSLSLLHLTCWLWENPIYKLYIWFISNKTDILPFNVSFFAKTNYYKYLNFLFLYLTIGAAISSIPYFGLDYTLTNPLGFISDDRILYQINKKTNQPELLETSFLNTQASDRNTRDSRGRHGRRERWKDRLIKYRGMDTALYDQSIYDLFTIEDLNYGFDKFWLRRKIKNHHSRFRMVIFQPWLLSLKKQLAKPRLISNDGVRVELFRMLYEQFYHPTFHAYLSTNLNKKKNHLAINGFTAIKSQEEIQNKKLKTAPLSSADKKTNNLSLNEDLSSIFTKLNSNFIANMQSREKEASFKLASGAIFNNAEIRTPGLQLNSEGNSKGPLLFEEAEFFGEAALFNNAETRKAGAFDYQQKLSLLLKNVVSKWRLAIPGPLLAKKKNFNQLRLNKTIITTSALRKFVRKINTRIKSAEILSYGITIPGKKSINFKNAKHANKLGLWSWSSEAAKKNSLSTSWLINSNSYLSTRTFLAKAPWFMAVKPFTKKKDRQILRYKTLLKTQNLVPGIDRIRNGKKSGKAIEKAIKSQGPLVGAKFNFSSANRPSDKNLIIGIKSKASYSYNHHAALYYLAKQNLYGGIIDKTLNEAKIMLHPIKFYLQKEKALKRKWKFYGANIFRKLSIENNAPYFRIMMKRLFYYYKPTLRWTNTLKLAKNKQGHKVRKKKSRIPLMYTAKKEMKKQISSNSGDRNFLTQFQGSSLKPQKDGSQAMNSFKLTSGFNKSRNDFKAINNKQENQAILWDDANKFTNNSIINLKKPTHNYRVVGKNASRYRYQIFKDVLQHWYYTPFNRLLLKFDIDSFIHRQPNSHFLTKNEEQELHLKRFLLAEHYDTLRWYTYMQHYRSMKTNIGGTKSFASRMYNHQFQGTFKKIRHLFAITPQLQPLISDKKSVPSFGGPSVQGDKPYIFNGKAISSNLSEKAYTALLDKEHSLGAINRFASEAEKLNNNFKPVLKFDQPLFNEYSNTQKNSLIKKSVIHEELFSDNLLTPLDLLQSRKNDNKEVLKSDLEELRKKDKEFFSFATPWFSYNNSYNNDLITQSTLIIKDYLKNAKEKRTEKIKNFLLKKNYKEFTKFIFTGHKTRGFKATTNQYAFYMQEKEYLNLTPGFMAATRYNPSEGSPSAAAKKNTTDIKNLNQTSFISQNHAEDIRMIRKAPWFMAEKPFTKKISGFFKLNYTPWYTQKQNLLNPISHGPSESIPGYTIAASLASLEQDLWFKFLKNYKKGFYDQEFLTKFLERRIKKKEKRQQKKEKELKMRLKRLKIWLAPNLDPLVSGNAVSKKPFFVPLTAAFRVSSLLKRGPYELPSEFEPEGSAAANKKLDSYSYLNRFLRAPERVKINYHNAASLENYHQTSLRNAIKDGLLNITNNFSYKDSMGMNILPNSLKFSSSEAAILKLKAASLEKESNAASLENKNLLTNTQKLLYISYLKTKILSNVIKIKIKDIINLSYKTTKKTLLTSLLKKNYYSDAIRTWDMKDKMLKKRKRSRKKYTKEIKKAQTTLIKMIKKQKPALLSVLKQTTVKNSDLTESNFMLRKDQGPLTLTRVKPNFKTNNFSSSEKENFYFSVAEKENKRNFIHSSGFEINLNNGVIASLHPRNEFRQKGEVLKDNSSHALNEKPNSNLNLYLISLNNKKKNNFKVSSASERKLTNIKKSLRFKKLSDNEPNLNENSLNGLVPGGGQVQSQNFLYFNTLYGKKFEIKQKFRRKKTKNRRNQRYGRLHHRVTHPSFNAILERKSANMVPEKRLQLLTKNYVEKGTKMNFIANATKKRKSKKRFWKKYKKGINNEKLRKAKKQNRDTIATQRTNLITKQIKRLKLKLKLQEWWWKEVLQTKLKKKSVGTERNWKLEKERQLQATLTKLSKTEILERDFKNNSNSFSDKELQIGDYDFKPLAIPQALRLSDNLINEKKLSFSDEFSTNLNQTTKFNSLPLATPNKNNNINLKKLHLVNFNFSKNRLLTETVIPDKPFLLTTNPLPFYAGWDESLRKFVVTNRLLSRREAGYSIYTQRHFANKNLVNNKNSLNLNGSLIGIKNKIEFTNSPLQGMNAGTTLYCQVPFTTFDPDQLFSKGMDGFAPIGWRRFDFTNTIFKTQSLLNRFASFNYAKHAFSNNGTFSDLFSKKLRLELNNQGTLTKPDLKPLIIQNNFFSKLDNKNKKINFKPTVLFSEFYQKKYTNYSRRLKKHYKRIKKLQSEKVPVFLISGPLIHEVLPIHYINVFNKQNRLSRDRYIKRRLRRGKKGVPKAIKEFTTKNAYNIKINAFNAKHKGSLKDFTLRRRIKTRRKYHRKPYATKGIEIRPRRHKFFTEFNTKLTLNSELKKKEKKEVKDLELRSIPKNSLRKRPSRRKIKKTRDYDKNLTTKNRLVNFAKRQKIQKTGALNARLRQLRRRVSRQVLKTIPRRRPRAGGFIWPGDYLRLEQTESPKLILKNKEFKVSTNSISNNGKTISEDKQKIPRKIDKSGTTLLLDLYVQPRKYLLEKHNIKVIKKKLEKVNLYS